MSKKEELELLTEIMKETGLTEDEVRSDRNFSELLSEIENK